MSSYVKRNILILAACAVIAAAMYASVVSAAAAETLAPWWRVGTGTRPTSLGGPEKAKVQRLRLKVTATKGDYLVGNPETYIGQLFELLEGKRTAAEVTAGVVLPFSANASQVQQALQKAFPERTVEVSEEAEEATVEAHTKVFVITFSVLVYPAPPGVSPILTEQGEGSLAETYLGAEKLELEGVAAPPVEVSETQAGTVSENQVVVTAENVGNAPTNGKVTIQDQLPPGLTATRIEGLAGGSGAFKLGTPRCTLATLTCTYEANEKVIPPYETLEVRIAVKTSGAKSGELNRATVSGGGAVASSSASHEIEVGGAQRFGIEDYELIPEEPGGAIDTQAGSHPFQLTSVVTLTSQTPDQEGNARGVALAKDVIAELPPGFIGNPTPFAQCTDAQFAISKTVKTLKGSELIVNECPAASAIGVVSLTVNEPGALHFDTISAPIFNMVPRAGEPARFGFKAAGVVAAFLDTSIRTGGDYGVTVSSLNIPEAQSLLGARLTFWGVPGASVHDNQRGWDCLQEIGACPASNETAPPPFLIMPSSCQQPFESTIRADSWAAAGKPTEVATPLTYHLPEAIDGCNHLPFAPEIKVTPDGSAASTPTGLNVDVHLPQSSILNGESLSESAIKAIEVALPPGMAIDPSGANGLETCSEGLVGYLPSQSTPPEQLHFTPTLPEPLQPGGNFCPDASKVATADISTPLLPKGQDLKGSVYLATQNENPFGSLIAMYIVAEDPVSGALVKLPGEVHLSESGQIITTFRNTPQLAFEDAQLHFFGGERAPLATPSHCGSYTTTASFTPWSGNGAVSSQSTFDITTGPHGGPCPGANLPFSPTLAAGTTNIQAGAFSTLTSTIGREDGQQDLASVSLHMPPGLSGILAGVPLCPEAQGNAGTCPQASEIGETTVSAGLGQDPVSVTGGKVYITEKYRGAPFGLSIVNPVKAGPFDLERDSSNPAQNPPCDCVVVRAKIEIDPFTAQLTVTTDPSGPYAIPHMIDGVPVQIKHVNVLINRPGFTFNPTNCNHQAISGTIAGDEGASLALQEPFQATNCATLAFKPGFNVQTAGRTSKAKGASLSVKLSYPKAPFGSQSNIAMVKVDLPKQLPSRLTTLQKACVAKTFEANPASCPADSIVGHAKVTTPLLPVPLVGPAYFVSHGNEAFPSLTIVLQGYGVTVELVGSTFIKKGITSSTFKATPDTPFNTFELTLPQGPFSALAANGNLCANTKTTTVTKRVAVKRNGRTVQVLRKVKQTTTPPLSMPTAFIAQNGAQIHQSTPIAVTGCVKAKAKKAKKGKKRK